MSAVDRTAPDHARGRDSSVEAPSALAELTHYTAYAALAALAGIALVAAITALSYAAEARALLGFSFEAADGDPRVAVGIVANNASIMAMPLLAALTLATSRRIAETARGLQEERGNARLLVAMRVGADLIILAAMALNLGVVGFTVGAYGTAMLWAMLPHGVFELTAFSLALAVYAAQRRRIFPAGPAAAAAALALLSLVAAALLETYA